MRGVEVIEDPATAAVALDPIRAQLLAELAASPASAAAVGERIGLTRQKANYHLKTLEEHGLVELAEIRMRGGIAERVLRTTAATFVVSPAAIAASGARPEHVNDRLSADYLVTLGGRLMSEVGALSRAADDASKRLPTFGLDAEIRFRNAADRAAFADELTDAILTLVSRYHHADGRSHRIVVASHPTPKHEESSR